MNLVEQIAISWGWTGLQPYRVVEQNVFGNLVIKDVDGTFWRICPEELSCHVIARDLAEFERLWKKSDFALDWNMESLANIAQQTVGALSLGKCYCLKLPAAVGGKYEPENIGSVKLLELISFSGELAYQIKDSPDRANIHLKIVD